MALRRVGLVAALLAMGVLPTVALLAQDGDVVKQRQADMKTMGKDMGAVKTLIGGPADKLGEVKQHAANISRIAKEIPGLFPAGSDVGESDALPVIWTDQAGFQQAAQRLDDLATQLGASADTGDAKQVAAAFAAVGKNGCGGCHQTYRKPQD